MDIHHDYTADENRYDSMAYNRVGKSGLKFPAVSLGFWHNFGSKDNFDNMEAMCEAAFDNGITQFDLANNYGPHYGAAEESLRLLMKKDFMKYRDELVITTKAGYDMWPGPYGDHGSKKYLTASIDQSLKRMGLDYVDIFYHHRPDPDTPLEETMEALYQIVRSGKALYVGISNYNCEQTAAAIKMARKMKLPLIVNQRRYSIFERKIEREGTKDLCAKEGLGIIAFSPLAQGLLTDKYIHGIPEDSRAARDGRYLHREDITEEKIAKIQRLNDLAHDRGQSLAQMALSWILKDGEVCSVLIGASRPEQIIENARVAEKSAFTEEELRIIDENSLN